MNRPRDPDHPTTDAPALPGPRARQLIVTGAALLAVLIGALVLVDRAADLGAVLDALGTAPPLALLACLAAQVIVQAGYAVVLRALVAAHGGLTLPYWTALRVNLASLGATRLVAPGGAGGLAVTYWALRQLGDDGRRALSRVLALNIGVYAVFAALGWVAALVLALTRTGDPPAGMLVGWLAGVPACVAAGVVLAWLAGRRDGPRRPGRLRTGLRAVVDGLVGVGRLARDGRQSPRFLAGSLVFWLADMTCLGIAVWAVGGRLSPPEIVIAFATGYVAMLAPLPTGGFGAVDAAVALTLVSLGLPVAAALAAVAIWRAFNFWLPTGPGLVALAGLREVGRDLRAAARGTAAAGG